MEDNVHEKIVGLVEKYGEGWQCSEKPLSLTWW